jgi:hypothetical protein
MAVLAATFVFLAVACEPTETTPAAAPVAPVVQESVYSPPPVIEQPSSSAPKPSPKPSSPKPTVKKSSTAPASAPRCHPSYTGACLDPDASDYDCAGGTGDGPKYVDGPVNVVGPDEYGLDRDHDGIGCE